MSYCRTCGEQFEWGYCNGRWVLLEPTESHDDLARTYVDENGELRADHRDRHAEGTATVNVERLQKKVPVAKVEEEQSRLRRFATAAGLTRGKG